MKGIFLLAFIGLVFAMPAFLQAESDCDTAGLQTAIQAQLDELEDDPVAALVAIINLAFDGIFGCSDDSWSFSGQQGAQPVVGPLALREGYYIFTLTTAGGARIDAIALEACGKDLGGAIFNFSAGQAIHGAENLVQAEADCAVYLEFSKITANWTLEVTKLR